MYPKYTTNNRPSALMRITLRNPTVTSNHKLMAQSTQRQLGAFSFPCCWLPVLSYINPNRLAFHSNFWSMSPKVLARDSKNFAHEELLTGWSIRLKTAYQISSAKQALHNKYSTSLLNWGLCSHRTSCCSYTLNTHLILIFLSLTLDTSLP